MADEYIRRVEAEEAIEEYCCRRCKEYSEVEGGCVSHAQHCEHLSGEEILKPVKSADVQPVKHGYWIKQPEKFQIHEDVINSNYLYSCSCCNASDLHSERANNDGKVKFCWRCGARMGGDTE